MTVLTPVMHRSMERIEIVAARTPAEFAAIFELRRRVFTVEQGMGGEIADDADDHRSVVALALIPGSDGGLAPVGTGRLMLGAGLAGAGVVTWVATLPEARRRGIGGAVMRFLLDAADRAGSPAVILAAQAHAVDFYRRLGFAANGPWYTASDIEHLPMVRRTPVGVLEARAPRLDW